MRLKKTATAQNSMHFYRDALLAGLKNPYLSIIIIVIVIFGLSIYGFKFIPSIFFPPSDRTTFTIDLNMPTGHSD